jgi:hypothetical protein
MLTFYKADAFSVTAEYVSDVPIPDKQIGVFDISTIYVVLAVGMHRIGTGTDLAGYPANPKAGYPVRPDTGYLTVPVFSDLNSNAF